MFNKVLTYLLTYF